MNDGILTLREALAYVNQTAVALPLDAARINTSTGPLGVNDRIVFDTAANPSLNGATINLTQGELTISASAKIDASMLAAGLKIDAGKGGDGILGNSNGFRIFNITGAAVELNGLILTGGDTFVGAGNEGGAIRSVGANLTIRNSAIVGNAAGDLGGAVYDVAA